MYEQFDSPEQPTLSADITPSDTPPELAIIRRSNSPEATGDELPQLPPIVASESRRREPASAGDEAEADPAEPIADTEGETAVTPPAHVDVPENIHDLLETGLIPSGWQQGDTVKYLVGDHPDLVVRVNYDSDPSDIQPKELEAAKQAGERLREYAINVLPSEHVVHNRRTYVVTKRVEGVKLEAAFQENPNEGLVRAADATWAGLCEHVIDCLQNDQRIPSDVRGAHQYMVGTMAGDTVERLWLVDLPRHTVKPSYGYEAELLGLTIAIRQIEGFAGQQLPEARAAMERALSFVRSTAPARDLGNAVRQLLAHEEDLWNK